MSLHTAADTLQKIILCKMNGTMGNVITCITEQIQQ